MRKRHLNRKLLAWIVGAAVVSAGAVHFVHGRQMKHHADTLLAQAAQATADGKLDQAGEYLKRYLSITPGDNDALERYGFILDRTATSDVGRARAAGVFEKLLARDRKRDAARRRVIALYLDLGQAAPGEPGWFADARRHAELLVQARPEDTEALVLLARCQESEAEPTEAQHSFEQAVRSDPRNIDASLRLAHLLRRRQFVDQGDQVLSALLKARDGDAQSYLERGLYRLGSGSLKEAGEDLAAAHRKDGKDVRAVLALADLAQRQGDVAQARKWWQEGATGHNDDPVFHAGLAALELRQSQPGDAVRTLQEALKKYPADPELNYLLTEAWLQQNDYEKAAAAIAALREHEGQAALANYLTSRLLMHRRQPLDAAKLLEKTLRDLTLAPGLAAHVCLCLGDAYGQLGNGERELAAYRKAVEMDPGLVRARVRLGAALLANGATAAAVEQLEYATRLPLPPDDTWTLYGRALLQHTLALPPDHREWDRLTAVIDKAAANASQAVPAALLRADTLLARGKRAEAEEMLAKATADHPTQGTLWAARARLAARTARFKQAAEILDQGRAQAGDGAELRLAALECWPGVDGPKALQFLRSQEAGLEPFAAADRARVQAALAAIYYRIGDTADGDRLTRRLLGSAAEFDDWVRLLDLALQGRDDSLVNAVTQGLKKLEGEDGVWWRYGEAAQRVIHAVRGDRSGLDEPRAALAKLTALRPGWARAVLLQAFLHDLDGDPNKALEGYRRAFDLGERQLAVVQRLVALLAERGRFADANDVLRTAQQEIIPRGEFARSAAEMALRARDFDRAVLMARMAVPDDTTDPARLIWLGQMFAAADRGKEAEATFRAVTAGPFGAGWKRDAWERLVAQMARDNRTAEAESAIEDMRKQLPPEMQPYALGVCYEATGRMDLAEQNYRKALAQQRNEVLLMQRLANLYMRLNQPTKAEPVLLRMLDAALVAPEMNRAWARRQLALVRADRGGDANYIAALALLEENRRDGRETAADVRALAFVRATRPESRAAALQELEASRAAQPMEVDELFHFARLLEDDWSRARDLMDAVLKLDTLNPEYLAFYVAQLLRHGNPGEARVLVDRLAQLEGESERVHRFRGELQKGK